MAGLGSFTGARASLWVARFGQCKGREVAPRAADRRRHKWWPAALLGTRAGSLVPFIGSVEEGRKVWGELPGGGVAWAKDRGSARGSAILGIVASTGRRGRVSRVGEARESGVGQNQGRGIDLARARPRGRGRWCRHRRTVLP